MAGKNGNAISFDGVNDYVDIGNPVSLIPGSQITMSGWAKYDRVDISQVLISKYGSDANVNQLRLQGGGNVRCSVGRTTITTSSAGLTVGNWYYLACTYDGSNVIIYVNGVNIGSIAKNGAIADSAGTPWRVGQTAVASPGLPMDGIIDEVRMYNRALSQSEIQTDMNTASAPAPTPDTTVPSTPSNLSASAMSASQISLSWTASTDNVGATGYRAERCLGSSCTNFAQVSTPTLTSYSDTGLTASTVYRYRVRAADLAGNLSTYSSIVSATTQTSTTNTSGLLQQSDLVYEGAFCLPQTGTVNPTNPSSF